MPLYRFLRRLTLIVIFVDFVISLSSLISEYSYDVCRSSLSYSYESTLLILGSSYFEKLRSNTSLSLTFIRIVVISLPYVLSLGGSVVM